MVFAWLAFLTHSDSNSVNSFRNYELIFQFDWTNPQFFYHMSWLWNIQIMSHWDKGKLGFVSFFYFLQE